MKLILIQALLWLTPFFGFSQTSQLIGEILDSTSHEGIPHAQLQLINNGITESEFYTDLEGKFSVTHIEPGNYQLKITSIGYPTILINDIEVLKKKKNIISFEITSALLIEPIDIVWEYFSIQDNSGKLRCVRKGELKNKK